MTPRTHGLLGRILDDRANFTVVDAAGDGHHQRGWTDRRDSGAPARGDGPNSGPRLAEFSTRTAAGSPTADIPRTPVHSRPVVRSNPGSLAIRMPLVFSMRCLIGRRRAASSIAKNSGCRVGSPPDSCTTSGSPLVGDDCVEHRLHGGQIPKARPMGTAVGVAHRAAQVAVIGDFNDRQAGVLHMVRTQPAVVGGSRIPWAY